MYASKQQYHDFVVSSYFGKMSFQQFLALLRAAVLPTADRRNEDRRERQP